MKRGRTGSYQVSSSEGERVRAFMPVPLPPDPSLDLAGPLYLKLERALLALGRLDTIAAVLPATTHFLYSYVRKEAVLSSRIEGTQSSISDLLLFELDEAPGAPLDDVTEVSNYVAALDHGIARLREGFPLSSRLIREIHAVLLSRGRGAGRDPGQFRRSQNWIGGTRPGNAAFVPPPASEVPESMAALERFIHQDRDGLPVLVRAGLAHVQFETIHPFLDGNGRVGRLLVTLMLVHAGILHEPMLYLSIYLKQHRPEYYRLLDQVRDTGDWERWLSFFLDGVRETAEGAVTTAGRLEQLFRSDRARIERKGRQAGSLLRVHDSLKERPLATVKTIVRRTGLTTPTAGRMLDELAAMRIAREITGGRRNRVFAYQRYLDILNEGTEEAPRQS
jgi:Fic family protein